jgi:SAM-dependent methyltransferase
LILCDNTLEHIEKPERFFSEVCRVLKNGAYLCIRTPNRWSYIALAATLIPNKYHSKVISVVQNGRKDQDLFPTFYKCNSIRKLKTILEKYAFECIVYGYEAEPSYLSFSTIAYYVGVLHQRFAPRFMRPVIFAFGKLNKPAA